IVNMSRGPLIATEDLIDALNSGKVGCAGLDVFEEEPPLPENPLWHMPNVYITPHTTPQVPDRTGRSIEILKENVRRYRAGE
ncbi:NAD(P)-dependent oxidoreductase, partial [Acinetobacter baumannii]